MQQEVIYFDGNYLYTKNTMILFVGTIQNRVLLFNSLCWYLSEWNIGKVITLIQLSFYPFCLLWQKWFSSVNDQSVTSCFSVLCSAPILSTMYILPRVEMMYLYVQFLLKYWTPFFFCFCSKQKTFVFEVYICIYECVMIDKNFTFYFLTFTSNCDKHFSTWHLSFEFTHF